MIIIYGVLRANYTLASVTTAQKGFQLVDKRRCPWALAPQST